MNGKTAMTIIVCLTLIGAIGVWGIVAAVLQGKPAPGELCTVLGLIVGGLATGLAQLTKREDRGNSAVNGQHPTGQTRH